MFDTRQMVHYINDAIKYGTNEAVLLYNIRFWIKSHAANDTHYYDGKYWVYYSIKNLTKLFPQFTDRQVERGIEKLIKLKALLVGNYNSMKYDRTRWFALTDEEDYLAAYSIIPVRKGLGLSGATRLKNENKSYKTVDTISPKGEMDIPETVDTISPKGEMNLTERGNEFNRKVEPIPNIKLPNINKTNINTNKNLVTTEVTVPVIPAKSNDLLDLTEINKSKTISETKQSEVIPELASYESPESNELISKLSIKTQEALVTLYEDTAYIKRELIKMGVWLRENAKKAPKSNYSRFILGWLERGWDNYRKGIPSKQVSYAQQMADRMENMTFEEVMGHKPYDIEI
jgi:hypothetical protein